MAQDYLFPPTAISGLPQAIEIDGTEQFEINQGGTSRSVYVQQVFDFFAEGIPPSGPAGGDLIGTYPNPNIKQNVILTNPIFRGISPTVEDYLLPDTNRGADLGSAANQWQTLHLLDLTLYGLGTGNTKLMAPVNGGVNVLTLPDANGQTLATTTQLGNYLPITGGVLHGTTKGIQFRFDTFGSYIEGTNESGSGYQNLYITAALTTFQFPLVGNTASFNSRLSLTSALESEHLRFAPLNAGQIWDIRANATELFVYNATDNRYPFTIQDTATNGALIIGASISAGVNMSVSGLLSVLNGSGFAQLEMGGTAGAQIDLKAPATDDYDLRMATTGSGGSVMAATTLQLHAGAGSSVATWIEGVEKFSVNATQVQSLIPFTGTSATFSGTITGVSATFSGTVNGAFSGTINGGSGTFGSLSAGAATISGTLVAGAVSSGTVSGSVGTFSDSVSTLGSYQYNAIPVIVFSANTTDIATPSGNVRLSLGSPAAADNIYNNDAHRFRNAIQSITYLTMQSTGAVFTLPLTALSGTAVGAGANTQAFIKASSTANLGLYYGTGAPSFTAAKGSFYSNTTATTTTTRLYVNTDGGTTWAFLTTSA